MVVVAVGLSGLLLAAIVYRPDHAGVVNLLPPPPPPSDGVGDDQQAWLMWLLPVYAMCMMAMIMGGGAR